MAEVKTVEPAIASEILGSGSYGNVHPLTVNSDEVFKKYKLTVDGLLDGEFNACEMDVMSRFRHPHLMTANAFQLPTKGSISCGIIMPRAKGSLSSLIHSMSMEERITAMFDITTGVHFLHQHGVVHCDLKLGNEVILKDGTVIIIDFGTIRYIDPKNPTEPFKSFGECSHMPPEMYRNVYAGTASEVWELGLNFMDIFLGEGDSLGIIASGEHAKGRSIIEISEHEKQMRFEYLKMYFKNTKDKPEQIQYSLRARCKRRLETLNSIKDKTDIQKKLIVDINKYMNTIIDLSSRMLAYEFKERISILEILKHPLFADRVMSIGTMMESSGVSKPNMKASCMIGTIKYWYQSHPHGSIEEMFLTVDIYYRAASMLDTSKYTLEEIAVASMWISRKLLHNDGMSPCILRLQEQVGKIDIDRILRIEVLILKNFNCCIYRHYIYHMCDTPEQLKAAADTLLSDVKVYFDVTPDVIAKLTPKPLSKNVQSCAVLGYD